VGFWQATPVLSDSGSCGSILYVPTQTLMLAVNASDGTLLYAPAQLPLSCSKIQGMGLTQLPTVNSITGDVYFTCWQSVSAWNRTLGLRWWLGPDELQHLYVQTSLVQAQDGSLVLSASDITMEGKTTCLFSLDPATGANRC
jgi:hypothetical protein